MEAASTKKMFLRYISSCLLVFGIPLAIIILVFYSFGYSLFSKELLRQNSSNFQLVLQNVSTTLDGCLQLNKQLTYKDNFLSFSLEESPAEGVRLIKTLQNYTALNPVLSGVTVHYFDDNYFYTNESSLSKELLLSKLQSRNFSEEKLDTLLYSVSSPRVLLPSDNTLTDHLTFIVPINYHSEQIGVMFFLINIDTLVKPFTNYEFGELHLLNKSSLLNGLQQLDLSFAPSLSTSYLYDLLDTLDTEDPFIEFATEDHVFYAYLSPVCDNLIFLSSTNYDSIYGPIQTLNSSMVLLIIITLIVALLASIYLIEQNKTPLDGLSNALSHLSANHSQLESQFNKTIPMQQHFLLTQLVSGRITHFNDFLNKCKELDIVFDSDYYTILIVHSNSSSFTLEPALIASIETLQTASIQCAYSIQHLYPDIDVFLLGSDTPLSLPKLELPYMTLYFGPSFGALSSIAKSYIEARTFADMEILENKKMNALTEIMISYKTYATQLQEALDNKEFEGIPRLLLLAIQTMETQNVNFVLRKSICVEIMMYFNKYFEKHHLLDYDLPNIFVLYKIDTYAELKEIFIEVTSEMLDIITKHFSQTPATLSIPLIKEYIHLHLHNSTLSSTQIAHYFYTSPHYVDRFFIENTDTSVDDYIQDVRIEKACNLLITTPYTLKIICEQIGYTHISSLISSFKLKFQLTPGQFRALYQTEEAVSSNQ